MHHPRHFHRIVAGLIGATLLALPLMALVACSAPSSVAAAAAGTVVAQRAASSVASVVRSVDLTRLAIGGKEFGGVSTSPARGKLWSCQQTFTGGGAFATGSWYDAAAGTYDVLAKPVIDGEVGWVSQLTETVSGANRVFSGNGLPAHTTGTYPVARSDDAYAYDRNPNSIRSQALSLTMPAEPVVAATARCAGGSIGIMLTGSVIFNALDAGGRDAVAHELQDACGGHPQVSGVYHYHALTPCFEDPGSGHSAHLGYAWDGFGIYGYRGDDGNLVTNDDLDECHGHVHAVAFAGETRVIYHYHGTHEYPYVVGCFRGATGSGWNGGGNGEGGGPGGAGTKPQNK